MQTPLEGISTKNDEHRRYLAVNRALFAVISAAALVVAK